MMVKAFRPVNLDEALNIRKENRVIPIAGGTDLMVQKRRWAGLTPSFEYPLLFIGHIEELRGIRIQDDRLRIGSAFTFNELLENTLTPSVLKDAISGMASYPIRNMATIGGNICNASPAGDTLPVLYSLDAVLILSSLKGERRIPIEEFIKGPGITNLKDDEILKGIEIPQYDFDLYFYKKVGIGKVTSLSKISFLGLANITDDRIKDIKVSFGAVAPSVVRSREIEGRIKELNREEIVKEFNNIKEMYSELIAPIDDARSTAHYRKVISLRLLEAFLTKEVQ